MYASVFLSISALFAAGVLAIPSPQGLTVARDAPESIASATALGINVYGPIPNDAVEVGEESYTAAEGTLAHAWIRAQVDIDWTSEDAQDAAKIAKREPANIGIGMFAKNWCTGEAAWFDNVGYGVNNYIGEDMFSVGISYRGLRNNEHLDFSKLANGDFCGQYLYSAGALTPVGCFNSQAINCFRLWHD